MRPLIFNVNKPCGPSSTDVVRIFRKHLRDKKKHNHFGTLDPLASGVLLIGIDGASKLNEYIHRFLPKTYVLMGKLGVSTSTGDLAGEPSQSNDASHLMKETKNTIQQKLKKFIGSYDQIPPAFSAVKKNGVPLYRLARAGILIQKESVARYIFRLEIRSFNFPFLELMVSCSSGTYMRTLFEDCAKELGTYGFLTGLKRIGIGHLKLDSALERHLWPDKTDFRCSEHGLTPDQVLPFSKAVLDSSSAVRYGHGHPVSYPHPSSSPLWVCNESLSFIGLGESKNGKLSPLFNWPSPVQGSKDMIPLSISNHVDRKEGLVCTDKNREECL